MISAWSAYLDQAKAKLGGVSETSALDHFYATAVDSAINAWAVSLTELKGLLNTRLSNLLSKLRKLAFF